jgi:putative pyruvate formate lyase activating enzyme
MPSGVADTRKIMRLIATEISAETYVNIMDQYSPCGSASKYTSLDRKITHGEYEAAVSAAREEGITRLDSRIIKQEKLKKLRI